jgi:hypothetical protein
MFCFNSAHQGYYVVQEVRLPHIHACETAIVDLDNMDVEMI